MTPPDVPTGEAALGKAERLALKIAQQCRWQYTNTELIIVTHYVAREIEAAVASAIEQNNLDWQVSIGWTPASGLTVAEMYRAAIDAAVERAQAPSWDRCKKLQARLHKIVLVAEGRDYPEDVVKDKP